MTGRLTHILPLLAAVIVAATVVSSCGGDKDRLLISEGKMEDVLYDYHMVDGIVRTSNLDSATSCRYREAVFDKHGITQAEFDSSMVYYLRHADILEKIYKRLYSRIENEGRLCGVNGTDYNTVSTDANSDTADIWNRERVFVLTEHAPYSSVEFSFRADSTFRKGDRFMLKFHSNFIQQDGTRNGYAILTMVFDNDSAVTRTTSLTNEMDRTLEVTDLHRDGVKEVKGYFMHRLSNNSQDRNSSTMKFLIVSKVQLIKMRQHETEKEKKDSTKTTNTELTNNETESTSLSGTPLHVSDERQSLH